MERDADQLMCCASCGYDLRGSDSAKCPECGVERKEESRILQGRFVRASAWWILIGSSVFVGSSIYRAIYFRSQGFDPAPILFGAFLLGVGTSGLGSAISIRRQKSDQRIETLVWIRASFWLYLSWLVLPVNEFLAHRLQAAVTTGMVPGDPRIADAWRGTSMLPICSVLLVPFLAVGIWLHRWRVLQRQALLPKEDIDLPLTVAIFAVLAAGACTTFDLAALFVDV